MTDASRTFHANQALQLGELVEVRFGGTMFGRRKLRVTEPDGPSTDGGRKARQSIVLSTETNDGTSIVCGFVDTARHVAEVRAYNVISETYTARHGEKLDFWQSDYDGFCQDLIDFLKMQGYDARLIDAPSRVPESSSPAPQAQGLGSMTIVLGIAAGAGAGLALGWLLFGR